MNSKDHSGTVKHIQEHQNEIDNTYLFGTVGIKAGTVRINPQFSGILKNM